MLIFLSKVFASTTATIFSDDRVGFLNLGYYFTSSQGLSLPGSGTDRFTDIYCSPDTCAKVRRRACTRGILQACLFKFCPVTLRLFARDLFAL